MSARAALLAVALLAGPGPAGRWQTVTRSGDAPAGIVRLYLQDGLLYGDIEQIYDPARRNLRCTRCTDDRRDAPFLGLQIIRALHPGGDTTDGTVWTGGTVLDPDSGRTYRAAIRMVDAGHLTIRGYLGIPILGASQVWTRAD